MITTTTMAILIAMNKWNIMNEKTVKIRIWGIVQGVGFRPFVAKLADRMNIKGEVLNIGGLVDVTMTDTEDNLQKFLLALKVEKPEPAEIVHLKIIPMEQVRFEGFTILDSCYGDDEAAMIPADLAICPDCLKELRDENNSRYMHPFISCMVCGPRYTIIDAIPYDRGNTTMGEFPMCSMCHGQYTYLHDRRYHAQTISCHECGPVIEYQLNECKGTEAISVGFIGNTVVEDKNPTLSKKINHQVLTPILIAWSLINDGKVVAIKGMGGYNFVCSPFDENAVNNLRTLKQRKSKPFAIMFPNLEAIKEHCIVNPEEEALLTSSARPIVLLKELEDKKMEGICKNVCSESGSIGAFLPSMGMQYLLLDYTGPVIVTSGNLSGLPMIIDDEEMINLLRTEDLLAGVFYNKRKIRRRMDDSVVRVIDGKPQMVRRAKGYAPVPIYLENQEEKSLQVFATGGQLKSSFALSKGPFSYVSQYFGDLDSQEANEIYRETLEGFKKLFRIEPKLVVCDKHPLYSTTKFAKQYAEEHGNLPILQVQHHHAHILSVMAENDLQGDVIGVAFDGTGYGDDGKVWGGEIFLCNGVNYERKAHLEYVKMIGGDISMKEGWKSAICYVYHMERKTEIGNFQNQLKINGEKLQVNDEESTSHHGSHAFEVDLTEILNYGKIKNHKNWNMVKAALEKNINVIESSSVGRLFDAVAALLGIQEENTYEGQCGIMLEKAAREAMENPGINRKNDLALQFHCEVARLILQQCEKIRENVSKEGGSSVHQVALSGGVFQNKILMEKSITLLKAAGFNVYYNISVSPNDGGICLGQLYAGLLTASDDKPCSV